MKIAIIVRGLTKNGVERFIITTLKYLDISSSHEIIVLSDDASLKKIFRHIVVKHLRSPHRIVWDYVCSLVILILLKPDVIIYPKNIIPLSHYFLSSKKINVIHDLAYFSKEITAYTLSNRLYNTLFMGWSCSTADAIISISRHTKKDIISLLGIASSKIHVIYQGVEAHFQPTPDTHSILFKYNIRKPYLFYSGSISPRKNILRILQAFFDIHTHIPHNIYFSSGRRWLSTDVITYLANTIPGRVFFLDYIPEEELPVLYSEADIYLYPSLYEGFGLPVLEAQACGCPVIASNTTSIPEVAGMGAHYVNPTSVEDIKDGMMKILTDNSYKNILVQRGYENVKRFHWNTAAEKIINVATHV